MPTISLIVFISTLLFAHLNCSALLPSSLNSTAKDDLSNILTLNLTANSNDELLHSDTAMPHCTHDTAWYSTTTESRNIGDYEDACEKAASKFYRQEEEELLELLEFLEAKTATITTFRKIILPRRYTYVAAGRWCVIALVMLDSIPARLIPDQPAGPFLKNEVTTFQDLYAAFVDVSWLCLKSRDRGAEFGWIQAGEWRRLLPTNEISGLFCVVYLLSEVAQLTRRIGMGGGIGVLMLGGRSPVDRALPFDGYQ